MTTHRARNAILERVRAALGETQQAPATELPPTAAAPARAPFDLHTEAGRLLSEVHALAGHGRRIGSRDELAQALAGLVEAEQIRRAAVCRTPLLQELDIRGMLGILHVQVVSPDAGADELALCDLGVTGADGVLPDTGTLVLRTSAAQPQAVSLLPRVHLAICGPAALCADLPQALELIKTDRHAVLITGPSRTADIEKTLAIGMHGPKALYVWWYEG